MPEPGRHDPATRPESVYLTGRNIGDEYRYILDRRGTKKFPGNMLDRPQLLLNPWAIRSTETGEQAAPRRGRLRRAAGEPAPTAAMRRRLSRSRQAARGRRGDFADLDFLADPAAVLANLVPDENGVIQHRSQRNSGRTASSAGRGRRSARHRGPRTIDTAGAAGRRSRTCGWRDGLDPASHFTQQKQVTVLDASKPFVLADVTDTPVRGLRQPGPGLRAVRDARRRTRSWPSSRSSSTGRSSSPRRSGSSTRSTPATS